jgi:hypothetical protein
MISTTRSERQQIALLTMKSILSHVPIVGPALEIMFEYRGKEKQERVNHFIEMLKIYFGTSNIEVDLDKIKSEEFGDLFENVIKKVALTRGNEKLNGFKNILINGMQASSEIEYCEIFTNVYYSLLTILSNPLTMK